MNNMLVKTWLLLPVFSLLITVSFPADAQKIDSVWFDRKWKETTVPDEHYYLRTIKANTSAGNNYEVKDHYPNGKVQMEGYFSSLNPDIKNGAFKYYSEDGILTIKNIWVNNMVAETFHYDPAGKQTNHIIKSDYLATLTADEKLRKYGIKTIDRHPEFPGGDKAFADFISSNLVYPAKALKENIEGLVAVAVTIDESGKIIKIRIVKQVHPLLNKEALRVSKLLPKKNWVPAQDKGKAISADFTFPLRFSIK